MCYRDDVPVLDLEGVELACLAGENGAGKSALLGAMTWALWGKARERVSDDELITQGATEMEVDFEFALGPHRYRVLRKRTKKARGSTLLNFEVFNDGAWKAITGHTVPETEKKIVETLRLDYETFINSAFLMQGRADSFTMKSPTERKELLGEILSLGVYDQYLEAARKRSRDAEAERNKLAGTLAQLDAQVARRPLVEAELAARTQQHAEAVATLADQEARYESAAAVLQSLEAQERELTTLRTHIARDQADLERARRDVDARRGRIAGYEATLAERDSITAGYARWQTTREREAALTAAAAEVRRLETEARGLERIVNDERNKLVNIAGGHERMIPELERRAAEFARLGQELAAARQVLAELDEVELRRKQAQAALEEAQQNAATVQGENVKLKEEMEALRGKITQLEQAFADADWHQPHAKGGGTPCPLCSQLMNEDVYQRVRDSYEQEGQTRKRRYMANKRRHEELQQEVTRLKSQVTALETQLRPRPMAQKRESTLEHNLLAAQEAAQRLVDEQAQLAVIEARLANGDYAVDERARLLAAERRLAEIAFDQVAYDQVRQELQTLAAFEARHNGLLEAEAHLGPEREELLAREEALAGREATLTTEQHRAAELEVALRDLARLRGEVDEHRRSVGTLRRSVADAADLQTRAQLHLDGITAAESERALQAEAQQKAIADKGVYDELIRAFGKGGIQAMIIESVIPELQDEANHLLSRMTDGRMHLQFETQRQAKTSDNVIETLDIRITDESGAARKYELFSGGEAFRINFAVRIALSKLLARRAGAQLQTLVIDEGFGTQDGQGRERLIAAIHSIQEDFACILVITHIQELKDEFPTRIEVSRSGSGSRALVN
jgi:exonuclease SbcC